MVVARERVVERSDVPAGKRLVHRTYRRCENPECDSLETGFTESLTLEDAENEGRAQPRNWPTRNQRTNRGF